jgi:hypothetical protein
MPMRRGSMISSSSRIKLLNSVMKMPDYIMILRRKRRELRGIKYVQGVEERER